ncbi:MAG: aminotransferase class I/II-fold pyridoxal phosphate-dependent enzyme [Candidatus Sericytochromatia bacterium]
MRYRRMPIEVESPEEYGYDRIQHNLSESSIWDARLSDLNLALDDLVLFYGEHRGDRRLRETIAARHPGISPDDVLVTPGAAAALFILHTVLLERGTELLVQHPNYATNLETPYALGADITPWPLSFAQGYQSDPVWLAQHLKPSTRLVSVTTPHNPSGQLMPLATLEALVEQVRASQAYLLVDETYRELCFDSDLLPLAAGLDPRVISVSSLSKAYGLPGIRIGWLICRDRHLMERCLAAKEQIVICNSVLDETVALQALQQSERLMAQIRPRVAQQRQVLSDWMAQQDWLEWVPPQGGVVCFPRFRAERLPADAPSFLKRFYQVLLSEHGTVVGPGRWFEQPDSSFRIGYAWPTAASLRAGLAAIEQAALTASDLKHF